jgi:hypothetical protein
VYGGSTEWEESKSGVYINAQRVLVFFKLLDERGVLINQFPKISVPSLTPRNELNNYYSVWLKNKEKLRGLDTQLIEIKPSYEETIAFDYREIPAHCLKIIAMCSWSVLGE